MYHPYFRGKQYELITIRERSELIAQHDFCPIIEPVKDNLSSLKKTTAELCDKNANFILIVNPKFGDLKTNTLPLFSELIDDSLKGYERFSLGYIADADCNLMDIKTFIDDYQGHSIALIHYGFPKGKDLSTLLAKTDNVTKHIFIDGYSGKLYQKHFKEVDRVLIRDGFEKQKNADYKEQDHFFDLHVTYEDEGMNGFGDFLIVGDDYMETGGPAYAIAIHLTCLDGEGDMFVRHFISDRTNTPTDPAGKFFEALEKLVEVLKSEDCPIFRSSACEEYLALHKKGHFPGLGTVKKLSMVHHLELIAEYMKQA
ncbi:MAG: sce7725 family protein [Deltaproteobacteria bacterium]|nr:sce7725 family protein [Deltaproteobacteria bacterium]